MRIDLSKLKLVDYEGAGNRTPVLSLDKAVDFSTLNPLKARRILEENLKFRKWLIKEGIRHKADSIMIYYKASNPDFDFVTFVGEPNAPLKNSFSEMCGNGIRSLALHILLSEKNEERRNDFQKKGIKIWAGSVRNVKVVNLDYANKSAKVIVGLGKVQTKKSRLHTYVNVRRFNSDDLSKIKLSKISPNYLSTRKFGIGFNGEDVGEPHLVLINNLAQYRQLVKAFGLSYDLDKETIISNLRLMVSFLGKKFTFAKEYFPNEINFNLALVADNRIYISTHERNMSEGEKYCSEQIIEKGVCTCNTMACGTGGGIVSAIAKKQGYVRSSRIKTIHPGGEIEYIIKDEEGVMIGPARRVKRMSLPISARFIF